MSKMDKQSSLGHFLPTWEAPGALNRTLLLIRWSLLKVGWGRMYMGLPITNGATHCYSKLTMGTAITGVYYYYLESRDAAEWYYLRAAVWSKFCT